MREIEVKFKIEDKDLLIQALQAKGVVFGAEIHQDDVSYAPSNWQRGDSDLQVPFIRIRKQGKANVLTLKMPITNRLDKLEYETEVTNPDEVEGMLKVLKFKMDAHVVKTRVKTHVDGYEICIDRVEKLGDFVEIEKLAEDDADGQTIQKEIEKYLRDLIGDSQALEPIDRGYDVLMNELS
jgi:adenylate cyclase class 2